MGAPRLIHVIRQIGALVVAAVTAAATINAYRPLALADSHRCGRGLLAWWLPSFRYRRWRASSAGWC